MYLKHNYEFFQKIMGLLILRWRYLHHSNFFDLHFSKYALQRALICTILCFWLDKSALLGFEPGTLLVGRRVEGFCVLVVVKIGLGVALTTGPNLLGDILWSRFVCISPGWPEESSSSGPPFDPETEDFLFRVPSKRNPCLEKKHQVSLIQYTLTTLYCFYVVYDIKALF